MRHDLCLLQYLDLLRMEDSRFSQECIKYSDVQQVVELPARACKMLIYSRLIVEADLVDLKDGLPDVVEGHFAILIHIQHLESFCSFVCGQEEFQVLLQNVIPAQIPH
jgi:hypothetical protein